MKNKLDNKNIELTKILFELKQTLDLHTLIGLNAKKIEEKVGKNFFAHVQHLAIKSIVIDFCKIYEEKKKNKLNSLPSIIAFIKGNKVNPLDLEVAVQFINNYGEQWDEKKHLWFFFDTIFKNFCKENIASLKALKVVRDSKIAHADDLPKMDRSLPSYASMEELLYFAIDFYEMVHKTYVGESPVSHKIDRRVFVSLHSVLEQLGHINIKTELDD